MFVGWWCLGGARVSQPAPACVRLHGCRACAGLATLLNPHLHLRCQLPPIETCSFVCMYVIPRGSGIHGLFFERNDSPNSKLHDPANRGTFPALNANRGDPWTASPKGGGPTPPPLLPRLLPTERASDPTTIAASWCWICCLSFQHREDCD